MFRRAAFAAVCVLLAAALAACSPPSAPTDTIPATAVELMPIDQRRSLAPGFPPELPVPQGRIVRAGSQDNVAWDYEIVVPASSEAVAAWYDQAYRVREWRLAEQSPLADGARVMKLTKGRAESRITITPEGTGSSRVKGLVGLGAPVLQLQ